MKNKRKAFALIWVYDTLGQMIQKLFVWLDLFYREKTSRFFY